MGLFKRKRKPDEETENLKAFLDMIAPSIVKFETGYYICGNTFRCIWALREYPTSTDDLAILRHLGEKHGVTLHIYTRMVSPLEERKIVHNAEIRNRMNRGSSQNMQQAVEAESNLQDVANLIGSLHRNKEPLLHCAVYIEMIAGDMQELQILQTNVEVELMRSKLNVDRLKLRQQAGFCAVSPVGFNAFGTEYERVLPASSVANLFPFNYSGKTDRKGFYIGKDKYGSNIVVDFDQRDEDKTSANVLILGNSGQGKSYLMKLLLLNFLEAGKSVITLDVEHEQWELCQALGGCFADIIEGTYKINLLEPRCWDTDADPYDWHCFCRNRAYERRATKMPSIEIDGPDDDRRSALFRKSGVMSTTFDETGFQNRYAWVDTLEDERLLRAIMKLNKKDLELLTYVTLEGHGQEELARRWGCTQAAVAIRMKKIKKIFQTTL